MKIAGHWTIFLQKIKLIRRTMEMGVDRQRTPRLLKRAHGTHSPAGAPSLTPPPL